MHQDLGKLSIDFALAARDLRDAFLASPDEGARGSLFGALGARRPYAGPSPEWRDRARIAALPFRASLAEADLARLGEDAGRIAFWTNLYNALASLGVVELGLRGRIERQPDFFYRTVMVSGGMRFCLEDIEQGLLRGNRSSPGWPFRPFGRRDPRASLAVREPDFRIHFALDRCDASSPAFGTYEPASLGPALAAAEAAFAADWFRPDPASRTVACARLFVNARRDFPGRWLGDPAYAGWKVGVLPHDGRVVPSRGPGGSGAGGEPSAR